MSYIYIYIYTEYSVFYYLFTGPLGLRRHVPYTHTHTHTHMYTRTHSVYIRDYTLLILPVAVMRPLLRGGDGMVFFLLSVPEKYSSLVLLPYYTRRRSAVVHIIIYLLSRRHSRCRRMPIPSE